MASDDKRAAASPSPTETIVADLDSDDLAPMAADKARSSWKHLFAFTRVKHAGPFVAAVSTSALTAAFRVVLAVVLGKIFDIVAELGGGVDSGSDALSRVSSWCLVLVYMGIGSWLANTAFLAAWIVFGELQAKAVREAVSSSLLKREMSWFDALDHGVSSLLVRIQTQTRELQLATSQVLGSLICNAMISVASIIIAFCFSWKLTLVLLATIPVAMFFMSLSTRKLKPAIQAQKQHLQMASKVSTASINAIDIVKIFHGFDHEIRQYCEAIKLAGKQHLIQARCNSAQMGCIGFWLVALFLVGFGYGVALVNQGLKPGHVLTTFYATLTAFQGVEGLLPHWLVLSKGMAAGSFLSSMAKESDESDDESKTPTSGSLKPEHCVGSVEMTDVSFAYPSNPSKTVLDKSSFSFPAGETTFIVGRSGSGKSTIGSLISKFYQPLTGTIYFDGRPLNDYDAHWIRSHVTLIQQSSVLFHDTFFNNVALGHPAAEDATYGDVVGACDFALLESTIGTLPDGLETTVGANGHRLSGGQKQRLALARARLLDPTVLILDEVTSSLDQVNRSLIMDAIREWRRGKTTIIITHDVHQIRHADYVYVMEDASLVQKGFQRDLLQTDGPYATMASLSLDCADAGPMSTSAGAPFDQSETPILERCWSSAETAHPQDLESQAQAPYTPKAESSSFCFDDTMDSEVQTRVPGSPSGESDVELRPIQRPPGGRGEAAAERRAKPQQGRLWAILKTLWPTLTASERITFVTGVAVCILGSTSTAVFSFCFAKLLSAMWSSGDKMAAGKPWIIYLVVIAVIDGVTTFFGHYMLQSVGQAWVDRTRGEAMKRILHQQRPWFDSEQHSASRISECLERDGEEMRNVVGRFIPIMVFALTVVAVSMVWAVAISWQLTLVALSPLPVVVASLRGYTVVSRRWETRCSAGSHEASALLTEMLVHVRVVRALALERRFLRKHARLVSHALHLGLRRAAYTCGLYGVYESVTFPTMALVFYMATSLLARKHDLSTAQVLQVVNLLLFSIGNATDLLRGLPQLTMAQAAAAQVLAYSSLVPDPETTEGASLKTDSALPVHADGLTFAYPQNPHEPVLRGVSLRILPGTCTALVGSSGCGKSTLLSLLMGLYPPANDTNNTNHDDQLSFAHVPHNRLDIHHLRSHMAYVSQSPFLFPATIAENILYGLPPTSPLRTAPSCQAAALAVGLHDFVASLPQGYSTLVGDGGIALSGGQAQRLSIARALVRRPNLLILDEPSSALDAESSAHLRDTMTALIQRCRDGDERSVNMAVVIVTHSSDLMRVADNIVVIEGGRKVQEGAYDELIRSDGPFAHLLGKGRELS